MSNEGQVSSTKRVSVTLSEEHYQALRKKAKKHGVSIAWVMRQAVDKYLSDDIPLLKRNNINI